MSYLSSGLPLNYTPYIDKISRDGILFKNVIASGECSIEGMNAILQGNSFPFDYIDLKDNTLKNASHTFFPLAPSVIDEYKKNGYKTLFITGYHEKNGAWQTHLLPYDYLFTNYNNYFDSGLYNIAIKKIKSTKSPYLMTIQTASTHLVGFNKEKFMATDKSLYKFYKKLKKIKFFNDGLLVIVGDHRIQQIVREDEKKVYGESAKSRIPLIIVGNNVKKGEDYRLINQSDLLKHLDQIAFTNNKIRDFAIHKNYNNSFLILFNKNKDFNTVKLSKLSVIMNGKKLLCIDDKKKCDIYFEKISKNLLKELLFYKALHQYSYFNFVQTTQQ